MRPAIKASLAPLVALLLAGVGCATGDPAADRGTAVSPAAFAQLLHAETIRLTEPMDFIVEGVLRRETEVVLLALRVADPQRFLPRGDVGEAIVVGGVVARALVPPLFSPVLVLAVPAATPLSPDALWLASAATDPARMGRAEMLALRRDADRSGPQQWLALPPNTTAAFGTPATRSLAGPSGLRSYARELHQTLAVKP
ncbi:hypothetical protein [Pelomonas cellulosilytica]|uniref:Cyclic nucleotide-binding domain-containing protein n=1 Tax=Pelomonas cellulosilytica TaxID=2906762 RepID=A0ABS8XWP4_9BURK|nr:hypothetical protein [Pelomonas sp. P8]MCE4555051.1 hypothetical protein [Pelomonas sp. P8]